MTSTYYNSSKTHHNSLKTECPRGHPYDDANTKLGRRGERFCRICDAERAQVRRTERRLFAIDYLGGKCVDCGYDANTDGFQFDHLPVFGVPTKTMRDLLRAGTFEKRKAELDKCELVCGTCHAIRTAQRRRE